MEGLSKIGGRGEERRLPITVSSFHVPTPTALSRQESSRNHLSRKIKFAQFTSLSYWSHFLVPRSLSQHQFCASSLDINLISMLNFLGL